jgi:hypothetical protein
MTQLHEVMERKMFSDLQLYRSRNRGNNIAEVLRVKIP